MNGLIHASLRNPIATTVAALAIVVLGGISAASIPIDILPVFRSPAVQALAFYSGMPAASIEKNITARLERGVVQATGGRRIESRSIVGVGVVRDYFYSGVDRSGALTEVNSLAGWEYPTMPPGTLPPVVLPYDPTSATPVCLLAVSSKTQGEATLFDVGRYELRPQIMSLPGAISPIVYGGKVRAVLVYLDRVRLQARGLSPLDVMKAVDEYNVFLPTGSAKFGATDFAIDSNSMFDSVADMNQIPLRDEHGAATFLRDVAVPKDDGFIQTCVVRVDGKRQVYIPVFRQVGASTIRVVDTLQASLKRMKSRLTRGGIDLAIVMDQSVYVRQSIKSLIEEGALGAILCSLVIFVFLGEWRLTVIAVLTIPIAVCAAIVGLYAAGNTLNVMTLAGLSLAIGPLVDSAIICLENTHRHLSMGKSPRDAAFSGASEVATPELVASLCTLLVLAPLALMPGLGEFLYRPMAAAVAFAMTSAYLLSRSLVPSRSAQWLRRGSSNQKHTETSEPVTKKYIENNVNPIFHEVRTEEESSDHATVETSGSTFGRAFARWESLIESAIESYGRILKILMRFRVYVVAGAFSLLVLVLATAGANLRREFFPEVDAGSFEMFVRAPSGRRIEETEKSIAAVEAFVKKKIGRDLQIVISEIGVVADLSAAYTPNAGPMDAVVKVQLVTERSRSSQEYVDILRRGFAADRRFDDLEFAFDAGGMIRSAMNEGKSSPINIRVSGKNMIQSHRIAQLVKNRVAAIEGVVDSRIIQRLDYPEYLIEVDRAKAADLGLNQSDVMKNVVAALNSSIQFHKKNFWIDPVSHNQFFVGVQYFEEDIQSIETLLDVPVTTPKQGDPIPLRTMARLRRGTVPTEIIHDNLQSTIDLTMGVRDRDLGHVADDVTRVVSEFGVRQDDGSWIPFDPAKKPGDHTLVEGSIIEISGEYARMRETFRVLGFGLILAILLIYFLMAALFRSYVTPFVILFSVPLGLIGVVIALYTTRTAINVQSLLGVIFMVGIVVSNTVLLVDFARDLRDREGLSPQAAIVRAASIRVRPIVMTAFAALFALIPMALALGRGSEANAPLGRAVIGGVLAGLFATLFVVPALYSLLVHDETSAENTIAEIAN